MVTMVVGTAIDDNSIRQASNDIQRRFDRLGQNLGDDFMTQFADGAAANAPKVQKAIDKAADATGRLRAEQEKLDALTASGDARRERVVAQSERVAKARRDEARAYKEAAAAAQDYGRSGDNAADSFMAGLRSGLGDFTGVGQDAADGIGGGLVTGLSAARMAGIGATAGAALASAIVAPIAAAVALLGPMILEGMGTLQMQDIMQSRMGLDESSMAEYAQAAGRAYANNFGLSVQDNLGAAQAALRSGLIDPAATDAEVQAVVEQLQGASAATEATTAELSRSITTLMRTGLAGSVSEASDIITAGFQSGLDVSGDWLDTINEYSTQFRKFGLDAGEVLNLLNQGLEGGARDTDKVADSLKEFSIRAVDGSKSTREGFEALGFSADEMAGRFAAGGESARVALDATFDALRNIDDPMQQALIWQRLFGTQFEDLGDAINRFDMSNVADEFTNLEGVSARSTKTATENFKSEWEEATRTVDQYFTDLGTGLADWFTNLPIIRDIPEALKNIFSDESQFTRGENGVPAVVGPTAGPAQQGPGITGGPGFGPAVAPPGGGDYAAGQNPLLTPFTPGALPPGVPAPPPAAAPGPGAPTPIHTDAEAEAQKEAEKAANEKPVIDPSRYSLDSVPIGSFGGMRVDQLPGVGAPAAAAPSGPITWSAEQQAYGAHVVDQQKIFDAETSLISQGQSVENARQRLLELEAEGNATAAELNAARTAVTLAERGYLSQQQKLAEAQQGTWEKLEQSASSFASGMEDIGAALDSDFGLSDGIPGFFENLTKALANLAAAPLLGQLSAIKQAAGDEGSGLLGMAASNGAFGPRFMPGSAPGSAAGGYGYSYAGGSAYPGDAALLANVPAGRYTQEQRGDLTQGLADCSSAVEDLVNIMDGRPTGGASMSTHNAAEWLTERGFLPGTGGPGDFRVGFNAEHMQATLPGGTPFNWGSPDAAARRGIGGTGAFDPAFTSHYYRPAGAGMPASSAPTIPSVPSLPTLPPFTTPDLYGPENTGVGLTDPVPATPSAMGPAALQPPLPPLPAPGTVPSGGSTLPGTGMPQAPAFMAPPGTPGNPIGQSVIPGQSPGVIPGAGAGMSQGISGIPLAALQTAASGLDVLAPGAGAAANVGIQLLNTAIGYGGRQIGNLWSGLFETFSLSGSDGGMTDPLKTLPGRVLAGIAGARPSLPNTAGGGVQPQPQGDPRQNSTQQMAERGGALVNIEQVNQAPGQEPASVANEVASQVRAAEYASSAFRI